MIGEKIERENGEQSVSKGDIFRLSPIEQIKFVEVECISD
jgi:hypothetical protein